MSDDAQSSSPYKRVLLKLSGESFCRSNGSGISMSEIESICTQIKRVVEQGIQLAIHIFSWSCSSKSRNG